MLENLKSWLQNTKLRARVVIVLSSVVASLIICYIATLCVEPASSDQMEEKADSSIFRATETPFEYEPDTVAVIAADSVSQELLREDSLSINLDEPIVALIIDDFGPSLNRETIQGFLDLPFDITISIIPGNDRTVDIGKAAHEKGKDVFIHLPMEPKEVAAMDERDMVYANFDSSQLATVFNRINEELPQAVGLNNHMGSRAMADTLFIVKLARELKSRDLVFVDSRTGKEFFSLGIMHETGVNAIGRDVFLDIVMDTEKIETQLEKLIRIARKRGWAVGIGHVRKETLDVLQRNLPKYANEGVNFVFARDLIFSEAKAAEKNNRKLISQMLP